MFTPPPNRSRLPLISCLAALVACLSGALLIQFARLPSTTDLNPALAKLRADSTHVTITVPGSEAEPLELTGPAVGEFFDLLSLRPAPNGEGNVCTCRLVPVATCSHDGTNIANIEIKHGDRINWPGNTVGDVELTPKSARRVREYMGRAGLGEFARR